MKTLALFVLSTPSILAQQQSVTYRASVIPIILDSVAVEQLGLFPGDEAWFELEYSGSPQGEAIDGEMAEKIWWIQDQPMLLLGSTGLPLSSMVTDRTTAYLRVFLDHEEISGSPFLLQPRKERVVIGSEVSDIRFALGKRLPSIDATYLSQVTNYLANNLAMLDVRGSS